MNANSRLFISACVLSAECSEHMSCEDCPLYFKHGGNDKFCALGHGRIAMGKDKIEKLKYGTLMKNLSAVDGAVRGALVNFLVHCASVDDCAHCIFSAKNPASGFACIYDDMIKAASSVARRTQK